MVKIRMKVRGQWAEFQLTAITLKTAKETMQRTPKGFHQRIIFLSEVIDEPRMTQWEWGEVPSVILHRLMLCIDDLLTEYRKLKHKCLDIINEMNFAGPNSSLEELNKMAAKRDRLLSKIKEIEDDNGVVVYSDEKISKLDKKYMSSKIKDRQNRNLYI